MGHNEQVVRNALDRFLAGDLEGLAQYLTDDLIAHVPGDNQLSGTYKSRQEFYEGFVGKLMGLTGGQVNFQIHDVAESKDHGAGIYNITATRDGKTIEWRQANVYHIRGDAIAEVFVNIHDFPAWNAFWQ